MNPIDKARVRSAFSRGARAYDAHAPVQKHVVAQMALLASSEIALRRRPQALGEDAPPAPWAPPRVLDVGSGTGALLRLLSGKLHPALAVGVDLSPAMCRTARSSPSPARFLTGDAEALPFRDGAFDLVISTSTFQWLPRLDEAIAEARRVLVPGGLFCLALFCGNTLHELRGAFREALANHRLLEDDRTHRFHSPSEVRAALVRGGLRVKRISTEERVSHHPDARGVLESLRTIGAGNAAPRAGTGLGGRRVLLEMMRLYTERHGGESGVPATYQICYAVAARDETVPPRVAPSGPPQGTP